MGHPRGRPIRASAGFTLIEMAVAMGAGAVFFLALVALTQMFLKVRKQNKELGDFTTLKGLVALELNNMKGSCLDYLRQGPPFSSVTGVPVPVTLLKQLGKPVPIPTPAPADKIWINADGSTIIDGNQYTLSLTTTNADCFIDTSGTCKGELTLQMTRLSSSSTKTYLGQNTQTEKIGRIFFNRDDSGNFTGCNIQAATWAGQPNYASERCQYPPVFPNPNPDPSKNAPYGSFDTLTSCPKGGIVVGVCVSGWKKTTVPDPLDATKTIPGPDEYKDCSAYGSIHDLVVGCCELQDPGQLKYSIPPASDSGPDQCSFSNGETLTGVCTKGTSPGCSSGATIKCTQVVDKHSKKVFYLKDFCHPVTLTAGEMTSCGFMEIATGFKTGDKYTKELTCCPIESP